MNYYFDHQTLQVCHWKRILKNRTRNEEIIGLVRKEVVKYIPSSQISEINALQQLIPFSHLTRFKPLKMSEITRFNTPLFSYFNIVVKILIKTRFTFLSMNALKRKNPDIFNGLNFVRINCILTRSPSSTC